MKAPNILFRKVALFVQKHYPVANSFFKTFTLFVYYKAVFKDCQDICRFLGFYYGIIIINLFKKRMTLMATHETDILIIVGGIAGMGIAR